MIVELIYFTARPIWREFTVWLALKEELRLSVRLITILACFTAFLFLILVLLRCDVPALAPLQPTA